eukprot:TRINITY_DN31212_c0_g1_i1.p2 TRINITY_DN31212_c0_g1~~TRINITY_DN31212_c0_g1_i1.p2  ORF type:complete len:159 (-),score=40.21 TRINITY_DN31212_c0_g1_i1:15-470(-)
MTAPHLRKLSLAQLHEEEQKTLDSIRTLENYLQAIHNERNDRRAPRTTTHYVIEDGQAIDANFIDQDGYVRRIVQPADGNHHYHHHRQVEYVQSAPQYTFDDGTFTEVRSAQAPSVVYEPHVTTTRTRASSSLAPQRVIYKQQQQASGEEY